MFFLMISCFLLCWTPYAVVSMMVAFGKGSMVSPTVAVIPSFFAKSSTAYNPLIYVFMSRKVCFVEVAPAVSLLITLVSMVTRWTNGLSAVWNSYAGLVVM